MSKRVYSVSCMSVPAILYSFHPHNPFSVALASAMVVERPCWRMSFFQQCHLLGAHHFSRVAIVDYQGQTVLDTFVAPTMKVL